MKNTLITSLIIITFIITPCKSESAIIDTAFEFSTIETENFSIHFHQGLDTAAQKISKIAEKVHYDLYEILKWQPEEKTNVVLLDNSDFANGFATAVPYNTIYLFPTPPSIDATIGEYDDWLKMLFIHEYAHVMTLDAARGYSKGTRSVFGKPLPIGNILSLLAYIYTAPPNMLMPRWWLEGISTWAETELTDAGRGRSSYYEMILRMSVAEDNLPSVDRLNGGIPDWPSGSIPYIYGMRLQKYIADRYGAGVLGDLNLAHAGRVPYFLSGVPQNMFGASDYEVLYEEMLRDLRINQLKRIKKLKDAGLTETEVYELEGEMLTNPRVSPDGRLIAYNRRAPHGHEAIMIMDEDGGNSRQLVRRLPSDRGLSWSPEGNKIYYTQAEINDGFNLYQDLYSYDITDDKVQRLSRSLRVREADISPDGNMVAAVLNDRGSQNLALIDLASDGMPGEPEMLTDHDLFRLSSPRWSPDGTSILYLLKDNSGKDGIYIYDLSSKGVKTVLEADYDISSAAWSPDGRHIVFSADETGVYNLFSYSFSNGKRYQITNLIGGAFDPEFSSHGHKLLFSSYGSKGLRIASIAFDPGAGRAESGPYIKPYWKEGAGQVDNDLVEGEETYYKAMDDRSPEVKAYSIAGTIFPRFWLPAYSADHEGDVVGALTAGQDVLSYNSYLVEADYGLESNEKYYNAIYLNNYFYPSFELQAYARPVAYTKMYSDLAGDYSYYEKEEGTLLSMTVPFNRIESGFAFTLGFERQKKEALSSLTNGYFGPVEIFEGESSRVFTGIEYSDSLKYPYSISREEGIDASLYYSYYSPDIGSDFSMRRVVFSTSSYSNIPFGNIEHDALYLKLKGGKATGDAVSQMNLYLGGDPNFDEFPLRGYPSRFISGRNVLTATLEYRVPIWYIFKGLDTKPFFWDRLHLAAFVDSGAVWNDEEDFSSDKLRTGVGLEARLDMTLGYLLKVTPALGLAHGYDEGGETKGYFTIYVDL